MKLLFDFFPIAVFFIAFKIYGIYIATAATMAASLLQVGAYWFKHRRFESLHVITLVIIILFGGSTLLLHDDLYIKWKPTVIYWIFALVFLMSSLIGKKPLIQRLLGGKMDLPKYVWSRLNLVWALFFLLMGVVNVYVLYHFNTNTWVNFKLFGTLGLTILFLIGQAMYMTKYLNIKTTTLPTKPTPSKYFVKIAQKSSQNSSNDE